MKFLVTLLLCIPASAWAQGPASTDTQVPGGMLMLVSYLVLWGLMLGYLAHLARKQGLLEDDIDALRKRMDDALGVND